MNRTSKLTLFGAALACGVTAPQLAEAGGIGLYEIGTPDVGLASAGYAARAQDASTLFKNPAGMSLLEESQFQTGLQLLYGSVEFSPNSNTSLGLGTDDGGNAIGLLPGASLFYVHELGEKWRVGFGLFNNFGLAQKYDDNWVGRYYVQNSALLGVSLMPSISYKITDWLSVGASLNAMYGYLETEVAINNPDPGVGDGQLKIKDTAWGFGGNAGILIEPRKGTRIGLTYTSPVKLNFADTPSFSNLGPILGALLANPSEINLGMTDPQSVMVGVYHEINERLAVMGDVGWQNWDAFGKMDVGVDSAASPNLTANLNYQDTWHAAIGAQYKFSEAWVGTAGVAYDSSAVDDENRTVTLPMGQAWRFGVGALWQATKTININAAYEFLWSGNMSVDQGTNPSLRGRVAGSYNDAWFSFFTLNLTWKF